METLYYRINHKNNLKLFDNASLVQLKTNLFYELSLIDDSTIGNEINKFFNKILECSDKLDKFEIIFHTINEYMKLRDFDLNDEEYNINLCQQISIRNYKMEFVFSSEFVHDIATLLCFGYTKLKEAEEKMSSFNLDERMRLREIDILKYEIDEIEKAEIKKGEEEDLTDRFKIVSNSKNIIESLTEALNYLQESNISKASKNVKDAVKYDDSLDELHKSLIDCDSIISDCIK